MTQEPTTLLHSFTTLPQIDDQVVVSKARAFHAIHNKNIGLATPKEQEHLTLLDRTATVIGYFHQDGYLGIEIKFWNGNLWRRMQTPHPRTRTRNKRRSSRLTPNTLYP